VAAGSSCRGTGGNPCDVAETCDGASPTCPIDGFVSNGSPCGGSPNGVCDAQDVCTGGVCNPVVAGSGTPCRSSNGECDAVEACNGVSTSCPADDPNALDGTACGGGVIAGGCDLQDTCSGGACTGLVVSGGTSCRASTGACDAEERCSGQSPLCPSDVNACCTVDAECNDGNPCTADTCDVGSGSCVAGAPAAGCCTADAECGAGTACMPTSCDEPNNVCITDDLGASCCDSAADCDDADPCTVDDCSANACSHSADASCDVPDAGVGGSDAGVSTDAGITSDAGDEPGDAAIAVDSGTSAPETSGGCGCAVGGVDAGRPGIALVALATFAMLVASRLARRRHART